METTPTGENDTQQFITFFCQYHSVEAANPNIILVRTTTPTGHNHTHPATLSFIYLTICTTVETSERACIKREVTLSLSIAPLILG